MASGGKPLLRSVASVGTLMFTGDAIAQLLEGSEIDGSSKAAVSPIDRYVEFPSWVGTSDAPRRWNASRSTRMGFIGVVSAGPLSHGTYVLCARVFPGTAWWPVLKKVALVLALAPVQISSTFSLATALAGGSLDDCRRKIARDGPKTFAVNCIFWPPILGLNMRFVALHNQATVGGIGHAVWNIFLAYMANRASK